METGLTDEFERYYGTVFTCLFDEVPYVRIQKLSDNNSAYILNENLGLYIKHATARLSPWNYSFRRNDFSIINEISSKTEEIAIGLVCGFQGVCIISSEDLKSAAGIFESDPLRITIRTMRGGSWKVSGSAGELRTTRSKTKPWEKFRNYF